MKQIEKDKLCFYCMGCLKLENPYFEGVMNCKCFMQGKDMTEFYKKLKRGRDNNGL